MLGITGQNEMAMDTLGSDKSLEQGRRKLDGFAGRASDDDMPRQAAVIIQISLGGDVQLKFVAIHGS